MKKPSKAPKTELYDTRQTRPDRPPEFLLGRFSLNKPETRNRWAPEALAKWNAWTEPFLHFFFRLG